MAEAETDTVNWPAIELEYRAGVRRLRDVGTQYGVSHVAIIKRAKRDGWVRDLSAKIRAKAEQLVTKQAVTKMVTKEQRLLEKDIVDGYAEVQAGAVMRHKAGIARAWTVVDMLFRELEFQSDNIDLMEELGEMMYKPDDKGIDKLNEIYHKAMSLPSRSSTVKTLLDALKTAIGLEREAMGITDRTPGSDDNPFAAVLRAVMGSSFKPMTTIEGESEVVNDA